MLTMTVGNLKAQFSYVLEKVKLGEEVAIAFGKKQEKLAIILPYKKYQISKRKVGIFQGKGSYKIKEGYEMTNDDLIKS